MWQVLLAAAAAAGSGILAKKLINPNNATIETNEPISDSSKENQNLDTKIQSLHPQDSILVSNDSKNDEEGKSETTSDGSSSIFRFSSTCCGGSEMGSKNHALKKKMRSGLNKTKKKGGSVVVGDGDGGGGGLQRVGLDQRKIGSGKRISICLKKRRTSKCAAGKCENCSSKESSIFNWGLGVGIMYMMSAGKSEISRLNSAMDETAKVVHELKAELSKKKTLLNLQLSSFEAGTGSNTENSRKYHFEQSLIKSNIEHRENLHVFNISATEEDGCSSEVLKEEREPEVMEMDQLEAEFVSELQKLPWCATEGSGSEEKTDICEDDILPNNNNVNSHQLAGVSPSVLDQKLCHLVIEQQESQIVQLESELQRTNSKLNEKEAELQALKDCVRRLTAFSLASVSDEENEGQAENWRNIDDDQEKGGSEPKIAVVGMKRGMEFETYGC